jgi:hypothetical protein
MKLKIGDKVKLSKEGHSFNSDLSEAFVGNCFGEGVNSENFKSAVCGLFAVHGVGVVKDFNDDEDPKIRWELHINGMFYYYTHFYGQEDLQRLSLLDRLKYWIVSWK